MTPNRQARQAEVLLWGEKEESKLKEIWFIHKLKKQIVPLGASLIDEEQRSGEQLTRHTEQSWAGISLRTEVKTSGFLSVRDL